MADALADQAPHTAPTSAMYIRRLTPRDHSRHRRLTPARGAAFGGGCGVLDQPGVASGRPVAVRKLIRDVDVLGGSGTREVPQALRVVPNFGLVWEHHAPLGMH